MTELEERIRERIQREGPIAFADYMQMALYEPGCGYYVSGTHRMGWEGKDYFTSSDLSTLFAACMGRQLQATDPALIRTRMTLEMALDLLVVNFCTI